MRAQLACVRERGVLARAPPQRALGEGDLLRPSGRQSLAYAREEPQQGVVGHARPPGWALGVAAVGRVLQGPRDAGFVGHPHRARREGRQAIVLRDLAGPPARHGLDTCGPLAAAQAGLVRHRE
eukprot:4416902-Pleurochrysis_carterae.AAC.1